MGTCHANFWRILNRVAVDEMDRVGENGGNILTRTRGFKFFSFNLTGAQEKETIGVSLFGTRSNVLNFPYAKEHLNFLP